MDRLDLHYDSLVNWFISHGKLANDCRRCFVGVESEVDELIKGIKFTNPQVTEYVNRHYERDSVLYYHFTKIVDILEKDDRSKQRNLIGQCTFEPLYNSRKLLDKYNRNKLYLVAYSEILKRNVKYKIPFLRSSIKAAQKQLDNLLRKQVDLNEQVDNLYKRVAERLSEYGLKIENFMNPSCRDNLFDTIKMNYIGIADEYLSQTFADLFDIIQTEILPLTDMFLKVVEERDFDRSLVDFSTINGLIEVDKDSRFDYFQNNKNALMGEIRELLSFILQIKMQFELSVLPLNISNIFMGLNFEQRIQSLNKSIELMNGPKTIEMMQISSDPDYRSRCASIQVDLWTRFFTIKDSGSKITNRIKEIGEEIQTLTDKLKKVQEETKDVTRIVETIANEMTGIKVKIIGTN